MSDTSNGGHSAPIELMLPDQQEIERGLQFTHLMMMVTQGQSLENIAYLKALAEVLVQKGVVTEEELAGPLERARQEVAELPIPRVRLGNIGDKYAEGETVEIDCASLIHLCQARCCSFKFYLTKQDLDEGVAKWDYGNPYWIRQGEDGYCVHWDRGNGGCTIHEQRPHVCRKYDCRHDKRVWLDFEKRIPAPMPELQGRPPVANVKIVQRTRHMVDEEVRQSEDGDRQ